MLLYCQESAAALSAAAAAATCVCRTSLYYCMYYAMKYSLCLALFVYGCASHAALPNQPDAQYLIDNQAHTLHHILFCGIFYLNLLGKGNKPTLLCHDFYTLEILPMFMF